jgi:phage shock protein A
MEDSKKIQELENLVKRLAKQVAALIKKDADHTRFIRTMKVKIADLEANVDYLSRRKT